MVFLLQKNMGRIRTILIKRTAQELVDRFPDELSTDFVANKQKVEELADIPSKKLRNRIAGAVTHLMKKREN